MAVVETVCFDADDTLWHNLSFYKFTEQRFADLLQDYASPDVLGQQLLDVERRNLKIYGFGIKGFMLSMIETALEVTQGRVSNAVIQQIIDAGREMLAHPIDLLPGVVETLEALKGRFRLVMITKGDLFDQERKIAGSGLVHYFDAIEIVSDKDAATYQRIFAQQGDATRSLMVGNSIKSDVAPVLSVGAWGVYLPFGLTWAFEHEDEPVNLRYRKIESINALAPLIDEILTGS